MLLRPSHSSTVHYIRAFVAVDVGDAVRDALRPAVERLKLMGARVRWVPEENWHLTVKFLGDVDFNETGKIGKALQEVVATVPSFDLSFQGLHPFPPDRSPRVLVAGVADGSKALTELHRIVDKRMGDFGVPGEIRSFKAHLTLARIRDRAGAERLWPALEKFNERPFGTAFIEEAILFQSELDQGGAQYTRLATAPLA